MNDFVEESVVGLLDRYAPDQCTGVVDEHVDAAITLDRGRHRGAHLRGVERVGPKGEGLRAGRGDFGNQRFGRFLAAVIVDAEPRTEPAELARDGRADAGRCAGDQNDLVPDVFHFDCLRCL